MPTHVLALALGVLITRVSASDTGTTHGPASITFLIDAETNLIHRMVEDMPKRMPPSSGGRRTTTIKQQANSKLEPAQFRFAVPAS